MFFLFLIWNLLHDLARERRSTGERVFGALCAYIFIGLLFALIYAHMEYRQAGTFAISNEGIFAEASGESSLLPVFTYYSFVTLTTLGYGDITPVAEHARTLAWLEALLGQLYQARISHQLSAAAGDLQQSAVFAPIGVLHVPSSTCPRPSGRKHHISQQLSGLATKAGDMRASGDGGRLCRGSHLGEHEGEPRGTAA